MKVCSKCKIEKEVSHFHKTVLIILVSFLGVKSVRVSMIEFMGKNVI